MLKKEKEKKEDKDKNYGWFKHYENSHNKLHDGSWCGNSVILNLYQNQNYL